MSTATYEKVSDIELEDLHGKSSMTEKHHDQSETEKKKSWYDRLMAFKPLGPEKFDT